MNLNALEKLTRQIVKGNNVVATANQMLNNGFINPAEHRSLTSLSRQIASNVQVNAGVGTIAAPKTTVYTTWI